MEKRRGREATRKCVKPLNFAKGKPLPLKNIGTTGTTPIFSMFIYTVFIYLSI
jgi:hypothetical protein